jgi:3-oxoacyl-[acyl-carrier protein] reductase
MMNLGLKDRIAVVCAASRGIGRATAESLAAQGANVAICARTAGPLTDAAASIAATTGSRVIGVIADLSIPGEETRLYQEVLQKLGPIDILVNNAGGPRAGGLAQVNADNWYSAVEALLMAPIRLTSLCVESMKQRRWGRIITVSSTAVLQPTEDLLISTTVRAASAAFSKAISRNLAPFNVLVHTVCPGPTATMRMQELTRTMAHSKNISEDEARHLLTADVPMGRMGQPQEIANLITLLASDRLSFCAGLTIPVDGGQVRC